MEINDFVNNVTKEFGEKVIIPTNEDEKFDVIPTGSLGLDLATDVGGIPTGKITEIYGAEGSGKSTLSLSIAKYYIEKFGRSVLYVDVENMLPPDYIRSIIGKDPGERLILTQPLTSEDSLQIIEDGITSGLFGLVILDSVGALSPRKEVESPLDKESYSGSAKLIARFLRKINPHVRVNNTALIFINQVRDNIGSYINSFSTPGGHSLKHFASLRIMLSASQKIQETDKIIGNYVKYIIKKNKVGRPYMSGSFPLIFGKGIDTITDVIETASKLGVIIRKGGYYYLDGEQIGRGVKNVKESLSDDPETLDKVVEMCYNVWYKSNKEEETDVEI